MRCSKCKNKLQKNAKFCPVCGTKVKKIRRKRKSLFLIIGICFLSFLVLFLMQNHGITEKDFKDYISYDNHFMETEIKYLNDKGYIASKDIPTLLEEIENIANEGKEKGDIENYVVDDNNIYIEFSSGIGYLFIPHEEQKLSNGKEGKILTVEPVENTLPVKNWRFITFLDKNLEPHYKNLEYSGSYKPTGNAKLIKNTLSNIYEYKTIDGGPMQPKYSLKNEEVTIESMKNWNQYKIIIFEGHGNHNSKIHSVLETGESFIGFAEWSKYKEDIKNKNIILTSYPQLPKTSIAYSPVRHYCITSGFIEKYFNNMYDSLIFLGACRSLKDEVLAQSLLDKGAAVVVGYNETVSMEYEMLTRTTFFYGLTKMDNTGEYFSVDKAIQYARENIASYDIYGEDSAELICISNDRMKDRYRLSGIQTIKQNNFSENSGIDAILDSKQDIYDTYMNAAKEVTKSGSWREILSAEADMEIKSDDEKQKAKMKATLKSDANVEDYNEQNLSTVKIAGNASIRVGEQTTAWTAQYSDGVAHYEFTEPTVYSKDAVIDPVYFKFSSLTYDMILDASKSENKIYFTVDGNKMSEFASEMINLIDGIEDLKYGNCDVTVIIDDNTKQIENVNMIFHASMKYQGYNAEADYNVEYGFGAPKIVRKEISGELVDVYAPIFLEYQQAINIYDESNIAQFSNEFPDVREIIVKNNKYNGIEIWYGFYDIDGNGMEELLLATEDAQSIGGYRIADVFTYDMTGVQIKNIGKDIISLEDIAEGQYNSVIYDTGIFRINKSDSEEFYNISADGSYMELVKRYNRLENSSGEIYYFDDSEMLSYDKFMQQVLERKGNIAGIEWLKLSEVTVL